MKELKKSVLVLLLILLSNIAFASSLDLNLTRDSLSANQNFDGFLTLKIDEPLQSDTLAIFKINNLEKKILIKDILKESDYEILKAKYEKSSSQSISSKEFIFNSPGSKVEVAIDLAAAGSKLNTIDTSQITKFAMAFKGNPIENSFPTLAIDAGNDKTKDFTYKGKLTGQFEDSDSSYLADNSPDLWKGIRGFSDVYCEKILLKPSSKYKILSTLKKINNGAILRATISEEPLSELDCETKKCCNLNPGTTASEVNCDIDFEVNEEKEYYACINAFTQEEDQTKEYFQIAADNDQRKVQGYYNSLQSSTLDYFIKVQRALFENTITSQTPELSIPKEAIENYLSNPECDDSCLLIPLNFSSLKPGKLTVTSIALNYVDLETGPTSISSFAPIQYLSERINLTSKSIYIKLKDINLTTPISINSDNSISVSIGGISSQTIKFKTVKGPTSLIGVSKLKPGINDEIIFTAYNYKTESNRNISLFEWDFNDGTPIKSGMQSSHSYEKEGLYNITLLLTDSGNYTGKSELSIFVNATYSGTSVNSKEIISKINAIKSKIESGSSQLKDTTSVLGINDYLSSLEANATELYSQLDTAEKSTTPDLEKKALISSINLKLDSLLKEIPKDISVSVSTFSSKITNTDQIPDEVSEDLKNSIFNAQKDYNIEGEARVVSIVYDSEVQSKVLVKKSISGDVSGNVYESLPSGSAIGEILSENYEMVSPDSLFKVSNANEIVYTLEGSDLENALHTKTIVVPENIEDFGSNVNNDVAAKIEVGSNLPRIIVIVIAFIAVILIIYFGLYFQGGLLRKKSAKSFFKNPKDYELVKSFVLNCLKKNIKEEEIKTALKKKNWTDLQINSVINEIKEMQRNKKK